MQISPSCRACIDTLLITDRVTLIELTERLFFGIHIKAIAAKLFYLFVVSTQKAISSLLVVIAVFKNLTIPFARGAVRNKPRDFYQGILF
jgi:hypothetical protein